MRTLALVWWLGLCAVMVESSVVPVLLMVASASVAAAVTHVGEGKWSHRAGVTPGNGYSAESR
jgi:hypothetical protein